MVGKKSGAIMRGTWPIVTRLVLFTGGFSPFLAAQEPAPPRPEKPEVVAERIRQARQDMEQDRKSPANVQVRVQLRNKEYLTGIIRSGRFVST